MKNRIRHYRTMRGWTLQQLATEVGTTPQTIQRLEANTMTVSTDWLERIARAFDLPPIMLLADETARDVTFIGSVGRSGAVRTERGRREQGEIVLDLPAPDPVALALDEAVGPYPKGAILVGTRLSGDNMVNALARDAIVALADGSVVLRKVVKGREAGFTLVPVGAAGDVLYDEEPEWIARLVMCVHYL